VIATLSKQKLKGYVCSAMKRLRVIALVCMRMEEKRIFQTLAVLILHLSAQHLPKGRQSNEGHYINCWHCLHQKCCKTHGVNRH